MKFTDPIFSDEAKARAHFEGIRWPSGPFCPHCGEAEKVYRLEGKSHRPGLFHCNGCDGAFTVMTGSVMESSHVPLNKWALAFYLMAASKKGVSAHQLHRMIGVTYKTAWFMAHRIREAMRDVSGERIGGKGKIVEADETYVGGKPRKHAPRTGRRGRSTSHKVPVVALIEREGAARAVSTSDAQAATLKSVLDRHVNKESRLMTDEWRPYIGIGREFKGGHSRVEHGAGVYADGDSHVNTAESFFALLKRGITGSFHHVSPQHLDRYCDEFAFRWGLRKTDDTDRSIAAIRGAEGKRLMYRQAD